MTAAGNDVQPEAVPENGSGAAAVLAAGIGAFALSVLAVAADRFAAMQHAMAFYSPTGPLSGVSTSAISIWLIAWAALERRWRNRAIALRPVCISAFVLLALSLLLTFPPVGDLL